MPVQFNQSVFRTFQVLEILSEIGRPVGSRELAREMGEEHTKVSRMLKSLLELGYLQQDSNRQYLPGPGLHVLAARFMRSSSLLRRALPVLKELHGEGYHVALGVLHGEDVCYLYHCSPEDSFESGLSGHELLPADESSIGLLLSQNVMEPCSEYFPRKGLGSVAVRLDGAKSIPAGLALVGPASKRNNFRKRLELAREAFHRWSLES